MKSNDLFFMDPNTAVSVAMNSWSIPKLTLCISIVCKVQVFSLRPNVFWNYIDVWCIKNRTNHSSKTLMNLVRFLLHQTLVLHKLEIKVNVYWESHRIENIITFGFYRLSRIPSRKNWSGLGIFYLVICPHFLTKMI